VLLLTIIYTINLPVVRPRSFRVIYYFDTPALGRRHQSFGRVKYKQGKENIVADALSRMVSLDGNCTAQVVKTLHESVQQ